jgi:glycosyltransferase domain-containing protein
MPSTVGQRSDFDHTLVITTYNRPALLSRLLDYLAKDGTPLSVLVLDSSDAVTQRENEQCIKQSPLAIRHVAYPSDIHPYLKIRDGVQLVTTRYASLCADDDVVVPAAIRKCVDVLERNRDVCAAHGWYFNFTENDTFELSYVVYRGPSVAADDPLGRLRAMFASYEAVFYAVYRAPELCAVFDRIGDLHTTLGRELLAAALTAVRGKILRIEDFYYGRNTGESLAFSSWHPHHILAERPDRLFAEYLGFRTIIIDTMLAGDSTATREAAEAVVDLIFLRYLGPFLRADVVDLIIDDRLRGFGAPAIVDHLWNVFVRSKRAKHPVRSLIDSKGRFAPDSMQDGHSAIDYLISCPMAVGPPRTYRVFYEFLFPEMRLPVLVGERKLFALLERLNAY